MWQKTPRAQGRSARGPILPKSNRNFQQPPYTSRTDTGTRKRKKDNERRKKKKSRAVPKELTTATNKRTTKKHSNGQPTTTINEKHQFQFPTRQKQQAKASGGLLGREGFLGDLGETSFHYSRSLKELQVEEPTHFIKETPEKVGGNI